MDMLTRWWLALAALGLPSAAWAQGPPMRPPMGPFSGQGGAPWGASGGGDWSGLLLTILVAILLIVAIAFLVLRIAERRGSTLLASGGNRALEVLKERYARGEIDRKEFEEKRRDLA